MRKGGHHPWKIRWFLRLQAQARLIIEIIPRSIVHHKGISPTGRCSFYCSVCPAFVASIFMWCYFSAWQIPQSRRILHGNLHVSDLFQPVISVSWWRGVFGQVSENIDWNQIREQTVAYWWLHLPFRFNTSNPGALHPDIQKLQVTWVWLFNQPKVHLETLFPSRFHLVNREPTKQYCLEPTKQYCRPR